MRNNLNKLFKDSQQLISNSTTTNKRTWSVISLSVLYLIYRCVRTLEAANTKFDMLSFKVTAVAILVAFWLHVRRQGRPAHIEAPSPLHRLKFRTWQKSFSQVETSQKRVRRKVNVYEL